MSLSIALKSSINKHHILLNWRKLVVILPWIYSFYLVHFGYLTHLIAFWFYSNWRLNWDFTDWIRQPNVLICQWIQFDCFVEYCTGILKNILLNMHIFHTTVLWNLINWTFHTSLIQSIRTYLQYFALHTIVELIHVSHKNCRI